jgi:hypothetical protein
MKRKAWAILRARARSSSVCTWAAASAGPKTSEKYADAARSRSSSEAYSVLIVLQLAGVHPVAAAFGALVHDDPALNGGEVAHHHHARVLRTVQALAQVDNDVWISLDLEQTLTGRLVGFVNLHQLVAVEPYTAAASLAGIDGDPAGRLRGQDVCAGRTIHNALLLVALRAQGHT